VDLSFPSRRNLWILGPKRDSLCFILTPLLIVPVILALKERVQPEVLGIYVLGFGGFGHHLPGFIRAYSDPDLFRRFKLRFTAVPLLLILICGLYSFLNLNALVFATVAWGTWHGAMQINGFLRIYDSKANSFRPATARLDWLMCLAWFGAAILHSPAKLFSLVSQFYFSGGLLIPPPSFEIFRRLWDFSTALVTLLFLANVIRQWRAKSPPSPVKLFTMATSFVFWWYCVVGTNQLIIGLVMWEIFHDVQYDVLVWLFQRRRVDGNLQASRVERFLFSPGLGRLSFYTLLILAYGYIGVATSYADINLPEKNLLAAGSSQWLLRISLASAILHFYFDGFIWRIREGGIRRGLGLEAKNTAEIPTPKFLLHSWKWVFFLVPVGYLGVAQYRGWGADSKSQALNLSQAIPGSWLANFLAGTYYQGDGNLGQAELLFRKSVADDPKFAIGHLFLGDALYGQGNLPEAEEHYLRSVLLDSNMVESRRNLALLYLKLGRFPEAVRQFQAGLLMDPENPDLNSGLAAALKNLADTSVSAIKKAPSPQ